MSSILEKPWVMTDQLSNTERFQTVALLTLAGFRVTRGIRDSWQMGRTFDRPFFIAYGMDDAYTDLVYLTVDDRGFHISFDTLKAELLKMLIPVE